MPARPAIDLQPVFVQAQIADDRRMQQADRVGGGRIPESWSKLLGNCRATDYMPAFENSDFQSAGGQVAGANQAIVAAANNQSIEFLGSHLSSLICGLAGGLAHCEQRG